MLPVLLVGESGYVQHRRAWICWISSGWLDWPSGFLRSSLAASRAGGDRTGVFMAPDVILADEPTGNLDTTNGS